MSTSVASARRRPRRLLLLTAAVTAACTALAGCQGSSGKSASGDSGPNAKIPDPGKAASTKTIDTLNVGFSQQLNSLDPTSGTPGYELLGPLVGEQLLQITPAGKLQPWLATSWSQPSPTEYVYNLRHGVKFWDGQELTADDVVFSMLRDAGAGLGKAGFYASVKSIVATDPYTVTVTLMKPDATWTNVPGLFYAQIYEKKFIQAHTKDFGKPGALVMGTGPFIIKKLDPTTGATLEANPGYWGGEVPIKHINVKFYASDTSMALAQRAGQIDLAPVVAQPDTYKATSGAPVTTVTTCATDLFTMPTKRGPWSDLKVRQAVAYAFNKPELLKAMGGSDIAPLDYLIAPSLLENLASKEDVAAALKTVSTFGYDLDKAKQLMAQSTVPNGFSDTIISTTDQATQRISQALIAALKPLGIKLTMKSVTLTEEIPLLLGAEEKRPMGFLASGACSPDPSWDDLFTDPLKGLDLAGWHPDDVEKIIADARSEQDPKVRLQQYTKILQRLAEDVPYVPLFLEGMSYASSKYTWVGFGSFWQDTSWGLNIKER